ncbi:MAG: amidohydrolase family protein, partial [Vicinamibacteria bacterium]
MKWNWRWISVVAMSAMLLASAAGRAQEDELKGGPPRGDQGEGPFERLILRGATLIDGTGAMPRGPVDIVIEGNRIAEIKNVGVPHVSIEAEGRPEGATKEIDLSRSFVLPGFVNLHTHLGGAPKAPEAEYAYKLFMAHGVTTIRGVPAGPMNWTLSERERSARNEIVAPRIFAYHRPGTGEDWKGGPITNAAKAREWVVFAAQKGIDGLKLDSHPPDIMAALLDEAKNLGLGSTAHLSQNGVAQMNALDAARLGLGTVTHFYGIFEALYDDHDVQPWPPSANYNNEQDRFSQVAMQWDNIHPPGSPEWEA